MRHPITDIANAAHHHGRTQHTVQEVAGSPTRWRVLWVLAAPVALANLDLFSVDVTLPSMAIHRGHVSLSAVSWIINTYAITFAVLLIPIGRVAARHGHRRFLIAGTATFVVDSALSTIAPDLAFMIVGRVVQAFGAAMFLTASLGLLFPCFTVDNQPRMLMIWAAVGAIAAAWRTADRRVSWPSTGASFSAPTSRLAPPPSPTDTASPRALLPTGKPWARILL